MGCWRRLWGKGHQSKMDVEANIDIEYLTRLPKVIVSRKPHSGYRISGGHRRCEIVLQADGDPVLQFSVFIRQSTAFIENFSIGLRHQANVAGLGQIILVRFNGPHGETSRDPDGHYDKPHIHRLTSEEVELGSAQPQERLREVTSLYRSLDEALPAFFQEIGVRDAAEHFPELLQGRLFNGC